MPPESLSEHAPHGERLVALPARKVLLLSPVAAGKYDPPMQEWLALPVSDEGCPMCGSPHWGTENPVGYFLVRRCHDGCGAKFRGAVTPETIRRVVGALNGEEIRLAR